MSDLGYTQTEFMICSCANMLEDGSTAFIGYGMPQIAAILALNTSAPDLVQVYEFGVVGNKPVVPFVRLMMGDSRNSYRAVQWTTMNWIFGQAAMGFIDYGVLGASQIDLYGNVNSTILGNDYHHPKRRFPGSGGANGVMALCWRTIVVMLHEKRRFPKKVDFVTSPGYLDGSPNAREKAGLPKDTGPYRVVSSKAIFGFDDETKKMLLLQVAPGLTVDEVVADMGFEPLIAPDVHEMPMPTEEQLRILREKIDPNRYVIGKK